MITGQIVRQHLQLNDAHVAADTIDYLKAKFFFRTDDWDGLEKWAHFVKDGEVYDICLTDDGIRAEDHLNLSAGEWEVSLHGNRFADGVTVQRITTDTAVLTVLPSGALDGEPFPEIPASVTEQILARLDGIEKKDYTPVKGTDYFTEADKQEIAESAAAQVDTSGLVSKSGGTMTGKLIALADTDYTVRQMRNVIYVEDGGTVPETQNGDLVLFYK